MPAATAVMPVPDAVADRAEDLDAELERKHVEMRRFRRDCVVVVSNVPKISKEIYPKLVERLTPRFEKAASIRRDADGRACVLFPRADDGGSLGFAFAEYADPEQALKAAAFLDRKVLDKNHTFWARTAPDFEHVQRTPNQFVPPEPLPVARPDQPNYRSWLLDPRGRDMFLLRHNETTSVFWNDHIVKPSMDFERPRWSDSHVQWSPKGTYMATLHPRGVKLWGRVPPASDDEEVKWEVIRRFEHQGAQRIDFSPNENYLVTFNGTPPERDNKRFPRCILVWDIRTGKMKRGFLGPPPSMIGEGPMPWPLFQWSHSDKYFARRNEGSISVYQTPDMGLLDKRSLKLPHVMDFLWSPTDNILAYWVPESENSPARVTMLEVPSRRELRQKALYSVSGIRMHWHQQGTFLCCKVDRLTKSKKGQFTNFELFRVRAKDIPVEVSEFKEKDIVQYFEWEPNGYRFAVIHGHRDIPGRTDVSFYTMGGESGELKLLKTLEKKTCNQLSWSPKGRFILLAAVATQNGALEWYDVNEIAQKSEPEPIGSNEHFLCNELQWDPSGRFVATIVSYWRNRSDNGYKIWTIYGKEIARAEVDMLYQFVWRPRPPSLLTAKQEKDVRKGLKKRRERYEKEDKELRDTVSSGRAAQRRKLREEYAAYRARADARLAAEAGKRVEARSGVSEGDDEYETIVETIEQVISVEEVKTDKKLLSAEDERD